MRWTDFLKKRGRNLNNQVVKNTSELLKGGIKTWLKGIVIAFFPFLIKVIIIIVFLTCAWDIVANAITDSSTSSISSYVNSENVSDKLKTTYENTGSLILANDSEIKEIEEDYLASIRKGDTNYLYNSLRNTISDLNKNNSGVYVEKNEKITPITLGENFTLYEHILNTERYNFNRINWGKYTRGVKQEGTPKLTVDKETRLQYPKDEDYDLEQFINMTRPYLQSWIIPLSMMSGVAINSTNDDVANFGYQIISEAYHKIEVDQHSLDTKTRVNNYRIYDEITTNVKVKRVCKTYQTTSTTTCTDDDYNNSEITGCKKPVITYIGERCKDIRGDKICTQVKMTCSDDDYKKELHGCTKGKDIKEANQKIEVCTDTEYIGNVSTKSDLRDNISSKDSIETNYQYVLTSAETFDYIVEDKYNFKAYYNDTNNYNEDLTKTDSHTSKDEDYYDKQENINNSYKKNKKVLSSDIDLSNYKLISTTEQDLDYKTIVEKKGKTYTDTLVWKDKLEYDFDNSSIQKGYNMEYLQDYLQNTSLISEDYSYYSELSDNYNLNLIDIMNANLTIFRKYTSNPSSKNIGYSRSYLINSYDILKNNLRKVYSDYNYSISYGQSVEPQIDNKKSITTSYDYSWLGEGQYGWPVPGNKIIGHLFGYTAAYGSNHGGIDLWPDKSKGKYETEVVASKAGTVIIANDYGAASGNMVSSGTGGGWGNYIKIDHGDGTCTLYGHLYAGTFQVVKGQQVEAGQVLAIMGSSGNSTGEHLHFELYNGNTRVDPLIVFNVEPTGSLPAYETLTESQKRGISSGGQYQYVSSK